MSNKVGKKTPVWRNRKDGRVVCGSTIQEALNIGSNCAVETDWERATALPDRDRVVIHASAVLPKNPVTIAIAESAHGTGPLSIVAMRREFSYMVLYVDHIRILVATGTSKPVQQTPAESTS